MASSKIEYTEKIIPDAYHGTSREYAAEIERDGFKLSSGQDHYFGDGVYFFESGEWNARFWAEKQFGTDEAIVLHAVINLGKCLDLHNHEHRILLRRFCQKLYREMEARSRRNSRFRLRPVTDTTVINLIANEFKLDTVRGSYVQPAKGTVFEGSRIMNYHQIMIAVRNTAMILRVGIAR